MKDFHCWQADQNHDKLGKCWFSTWEIDECSVPCLDDFGLVWCVKSIKGQHVCVCYYSLGDETTMLGGLYAGLCHAFLVYFFMLYYSLFWCIGVCLLLLCFLSQLNRNRKSFRQRDRNWWNEFIGHRREGTKRTLAASKHYSLINLSIINVRKQEAFEKCWAHSPLRAAARPFTRCRYRYCRTPPAHRCPRRQRQQQRQRVTEGTAMVPQNGPKNWDRQTDRRTDGQTPQQIIVLYAFR